LKTLLSSSQIEDMIKQRDDDGNHSVHTFVQCSPFIENLKSLWELLSSALNEKKFIDLLLDLNNSNNNVFHTSIHCNSKEFIETLLKLAQNLLPPEVFKNALVTCQIDGWNVFHYAACNENTGIFGFLWSFMNEIFDKSETVAMLKEIAFDTGENVFNILFSYCNVENFDELLSIAESNLNVEELKIMFLNVSEDGSSLLHNSVKSKNVSSTEKLFDVLENELKLSVEELKSFIEITNADGKTAMQVAVESDGKNVCLVLQTKVNSFCC
jgi:hypothetical protein